MKTTCDPQQLAALAKAGDTAALDLLTRCQGERLLAVGRRYCRTEEEARDAVQDAMVAATLHLPDYRGEGAVDGWVVRMVARACGRMRRGGKNDASRHDVDQELVSDEDGPEMSVGRARLAAALGEALLELDPLDRAVLLLAEAEDWTGPEIAAQTGLAAAAVRQRLSRTRRRIRERLAPLAE